jgi:hypothetical protein
MITQELLGYIRGELDKGKSRDDIHAVLISGGGWSENDLSEAFREIIPMQNTVTPVPVAPIPVPSPASESPTVPFTTFNPVVMPSPLSSAPGQTKVAVSSRAPSSSHIFSRFLKFIIILIIVGGLGYAYWAYRPQIMNLFVKQQEPTVLPDVEIPKPKPNPSMEVSGNRDDLVSLSVLPGQNVSNVFPINGVVKGGYFNEANIIINILDQNKNILKSGNATTKDDWMTAGPVSFETTLDFTNLPKGPAYIEIHNDNASGLPLYDKSIFIPVIIE